MISTANFIDLQSLKEHMDVRLAKKLSFLLISTLAENHYAENYLLRGSFSIAMCYLKATIIVSSEIFDVIKEILALLAYPKKISCLCNWQMAIDKI